MVNNKIKISELAKDFDMQSKDICAALSAMGKTYKPSQSVSTGEVGMLFDYLTQKHQVGSLEEVRATAAQAAEQRKQAAEDRIKKQQEEAAARIRAEEKAKEDLIRRNNPPRQEKPQPEKPQQNKPQQAKQPAKARPQGQTLQYTPPEKKEDKAAPARQEPQKNQKVHYVDTRGNSVNIARYDERMDTLVPQQAGRFGNQQTKQKLVKKDQRGKQFGNKRRQEEQEKMRRLEQQAQAKKVPLKVLIPDEIAVGELASRLKKTAAEVIKQLMKLGVMASVSQNIDYDTASLVAMELGAVPEKEVVVTIEERLFDEREDTSDELVDRAPVVVVMGHVDHGKTSLLDAIRKTNVTAGEAGGITQHIGAYTVDVNGNPVTFLDTPGHAAFTSMRARGAMCTDIAVLVVAADDGIMPQTIESINHAKAANIPIIVAINKMDKPTANPDKIKEQLTKYDLIPEEWGGDTVICPISAKTGMGLEDLLEMIIVSSEVLELKANPNRRGKGTVIEARLDKTKGPIATLLVQNGTLKQGDIIIAGTAVGRVRVMTNDKGRTVKTAGPSQPVEITGLADVPAPGDEFNVVTDERMARELVEQRRQAEKDAKAKLTQKVTLDNLFARMQEGEMKELPLIVKADVQGSAEAVKASLEKISNEEVRVRVIHAGVGAINESDILLASTAGAIIVGFNVRPDAAAQANGQRANVDMRFYRVIYDAIDEIEAAMKGMLAPKFEEAVIGHAEVRMTYKVSAIGTIAGCMVKDGKVSRDAKVRVLRDNIVIHEGEVGSLQRFKDAVKEVTAGYECGMSVLKFNDIKEGDIFECFVMQEVKR